jgi:CRISPR-associated helicase Cas3
MWRGLRLMDHQARALDSGQAPNLLVEAPTGGGKTWAAAVPLLDVADRGEGAFFVYPTNALADDQQQSLCDLANLAGSPAGIVQPDGTWSGDPSPRILICRIHASMLDDVQTELGSRFRGEQLSRLLQRLPPKPVWFITNPDTLYLLATARYAVSPQIWSRLEPCRTLIFDEFHLYRGATLMRALCLMVLGRHLFGINRVRILSATLPAKTRELLEQQFDFECIEASVAAKGRVVQHEIRLEVEAAEAERATESMAEIIAAEIEALRSETRLNRRVPLVALRLSVLSAIQLEDALAARTIHYQEIGVYRGLSSRAIRAMNGKTLVVGTSALEVGVDFDTTRLLFEAASASSFAQRLGRVGRHRPGIARFFTSYRVAEALSRLVEQTPRDCLHDCMRKILGDDDDLADFLFSPWGWAVAKAAFDALRSFALRYESDDLAATADRAETDFAAKLFQGQPPDLSGSLSRAVRRALRSSMGFRGNNGSVEVFDVRERDRRGTAELATYEVDLATFYRRGRWQDTRRTSTRPVILGWGSSREVFITLQGITFAESGLHAPPGDKIELRIDGKATYWEKLLREHTHILGMFPETLRRHLSWRETCFDSDDGRVVLLDDDALVAAHIWSRISAAPVA